MNILFAIRVSKMILMGSSGTKDGLVGTDSDNGVASDSSRNDDYFSGVVGESGGEHRKCRNSDSRATDATLGSVSTSNKRALS